MTPAARLALADLVGVSARLAEIGRAWPLVHAASPLNWSAELARLGEARRARAPAEPRFVYRERRPPPGLSEALAELAAELPAGEPLAASARELSLELRLIEAVGLPGFAALAAQRFACPAADDLRAERWAAQRAAPAAGALHRSDDEADPRSLVAAVRARLGALRLPVAVLLRSDLPSLAATADGAVLIARSVSTTGRVALRTALHEVEGHVVPWWERRQGLSPPLRKAGGADLEEGNALRIEASAGLLDDVRKKELGLRHIAARLAHQQARFDAIADRLEALGALPDEAVRLAARALRGGGLGRERAYLPSLWRLEPPGG